MGAGALFDINLTWFDSIAITVGRRGLFYSFKWFLPAFDAVWGSTIVLYWWNACTRTLWYFTSVLFVLYITHPACCCRLLSPGRGGGGGSSPQIQAQGFSRRSSKPAHRSINGCLNKRLGCGSLFDFATGLGRLHMCQTRAHYAATCASPGEWHKWSMLKKTGCWKSRPTTLRIRVGSPI